MTGDTENGRSISVVEQSLAAEIELGDRLGGGKTPKIVLSGTAIAAVRKVSSLAESASGSFSAASATPRPCARAWLNTVASGNSRNRTMKVMATRTLITRTDRRSSVAPLG